MVGGGLIGQMVVSYLNIESLSLALFGGNIAGRSGVVSDLDDGDMRRSLELGYSMPK